MKYLNLILSIVFTLCTILLVGFSVFIYLAITREPSTFMYWYGGLIICSACSAGVLYLKMAQYRWKLFLQAHHGNNPDVDDDEIDETLIEAIKLSGRNDLKDKLQLIHEELCIGIVEDEHEEVTYRKGKKL